MLVVFAVLAALAVCYLIFWAGANFGGRFAEAELVAERKLKAEILKERNELRANLDKAKSAVKTMGLDAKRVFPWLMLMACTYLASYMTPAYAQAAQAASASPLIDPSLHVSAFGATFYSPQADLEQTDVVALGTARSSIEMAAFSLTDKAIIDTLAERASHGVIEKIYLDRGELQAECRGDATCARSPLHTLIGLTNVEIRVKRSKVLMHLKSYMVGSTDGTGYLIETVRDGSANFSPQGERQQDNSLTFSQDSKTAAEFRQKFQEMWGRPDNLTVAQAVAEPPK